MFNILKSSLILFVVLTVLGASSGMLLAGISSVTGKDLSPLVASLPRFLVVAVLFFKLLMLEDRVNTLEKR